MVFKCKMHCHQLHLLLSLLLQHTKQMIQQKRNKQPTFCCHIFQHRQVAPSTSCVQTSLWINRVFLRSFQWSAPYRSPLTNSSLTHDPGHADEEHHTPDVQHAADLQEGRKQKGSMQIEHQESRREGLTNQIKSKTWLVTVRGNCLQNKMFTTYKSCREISAVCHLSSGFNTNSPGLTSNINTMTDCH